MATTAPPSRSRQSSIAAAVRVLPMRAASAGTRGSSQRADHVVVGRQPRAGDAVRHHLGVAEDRRAGLQRRRAAATRAGREGDVGGRLDHAAGVDDAHGDLLLLRREAGEVRLGAG